MSIYQRLLLFVIASTALSISGDDVTKHTAAFHSRLSQQRATNHRNTQNSRRARVEQELRDQQAAEEQAARLRQATVDALKEAQLAQQASAEQPAPDEASVSLDVIAKRLRKQ